jgi:hypothetical protein
VDPGDPVLIEKPVYAYAGLHAVGISKSDVYKRGDPDVPGAALRDDRQVYVSRDMLVSESKVTEVETDTKGLCSSSLREILESWPSSKPKPKILYTVPVRDGLLGSWTDTD